MRYTSTLIAVSDIEKSKQFYHNVLGLNVIADFGANVTMTGGVALQTVETWRDFIHKKDNQIIFENNSCELYFEEDDMDGFTEKLKSFRDICYVHPLIEHSWGQRVVRFYDLDKHIIEVGENMEMVVKRFIDSGLSVEETALRMDVPVDYVKSCIIKERVHMEADVRLIKPNDSLENEYLDMILEWKQSESELIPWSLNLDTTDFHLMIEKLNGYSKGIGLPDGFVECSTYWLVDKNNKILGAIDVRHKLNDFLLFRGGHIGYGIRPSERRKGYAGIMLSLALKQCEIIGISKVLITCLKNNIGSAKTIIKNQGVLESEDTDNGEIFQRYWIDCEHYPYSTS